MTRGFSDAPLTSRLPKARGTYTEWAPLDKTTGYRVGGPAEVLFKPADEDDLSRFLSHLAVNIPVTVLGMGSNVLVRDGGIPGVVIRMGREFGGVQVRKPEILVGAAALNMSVANTARDASLSGIEFLSGIPGTIGGSLRMNAGAFGRELKDVVVSARAIDHHGGIHDLDPAGLQFGYRECGVPEEWIFLSAVLRCQPGPQAEIQRRMVQIQAARDSSQPLRVPSGGSVFRNPPGGRSAWQLIEEAGCRGLTRGGAQVSEKHCNFIVNIGDARASDIEDLAEEVRARVKEKTGVTLEWEVRRIGIPDERSKVRR